MGSILNRVIIFIGISALLLNEFNLSNAILPMVLAVAISSFLEYFNNERLSSALFLFYLILSVFFPSYIFFLPLVSYDLLRTKKELIALLTFIPFAIHFSKFSHQTIVILIIVCFIIYFLKTKANQINKLHLDYISQRDYLTELSISLEEKMNELVIKQDTEVNLATLNERNRIAREIHDNVGHLLSSSILQISAIISTCKEENTIKSLEVVRDILDNGMNSIRKSVHNLHDNSIELYTEIKRLSDEFTFCKIRVDYEITSKMTAKEKYAIIAIIKEALSNTIKHSNAEYITIGLYEHPKLYQLIIYDNGTRKTDIKSSEGMGLQSIRQRVASLNGIVNFNSSNGFKIFISFMKNNSEDYKSE